MTSLVNENERAACMDKGNGSQGDPEVLFQVSSLKGENAT